MSHPPGRSAARPEPPVLRSGHVAEVPLPGGDVTVGVVRAGDTVRRPTGPHSPVVHALLAHLERVGFDGAPRFLGIDDRGREVLTYVDGDVAGRPRPDWIADEERLVSLARLLRRYDDAATTFVLPPDLRPTWEPHDTPDLPPAPPGDPELVGHLDVTPENVVFRDGRAFALIDFDLVRPATRVDEVVNALQWWAPLGDPQDSDPLLRDVDVPRRCRLFVDAYGLPAQDRTRVVPAALLRTRRSWHLMHRRAEVDGGGWARMWSEGVGDVIRRREAWLLAHGDRVTAALTA
jgi:hypothetical protein